jgi:sec-independent protein translocase protein TatA
MGSIGVPELILVFVILLLIFGGRKIPELARGLGAGIRNFRESLRGESAGEKKDKEP